MNQPQTVSEIDINLPRPRSSLGAEYITLRKEWKEKDVSLDEKLMAVYLKAITHLDDFKPRRIPGATQEFITDHQDYKKASKEDKVAAWKQILEHHAGYLKAIDEAISENKSNLCFLKEMETFFNGKKIQSYAEKCRTMINKHEEAKYEGW